jgi:hypothetical protein
MAIPGSIDQMVQQKMDAYRGNPGALQQRYQQNQDLIDLLALQKLKSEKESAAREMQMSMEQNPRTIAEQREQEVLGLTKDEVVSQVGDVLRQRQAAQARNLQRVAMGRAPAPIMSGIASQPAPNMTGMAGGGIVAFAEGAEVEAPDGWEKRMREEEEKRRLAYVPYPYNLYPSVPGPLGPEPELRPGAGIAEKLRYHEAKAARERQALVNRLQDIPINDGVPAPAPAPDAAPDAAAGAAPARAGATAPGASVAGPVPPAPGALPSMQLVKPTTPDLDAAEAKRVARVGELLDDKGIAALRQKQRQDLEKFYKETLPSMRKESELADLLAAGGGGYGALGKVGQRYAQRQEQDIRAAEIAALKMAGLTDSEIADKLGIGKAKVEAGTAAIAAALKGTELRLNADIANAKNELTRTTLDIERDKLAALETSRLGELYQNLVTKMGALREKMDVGLRKSIDALNFDPTYTKANAKDKEKRKADIIAKARVEFEKEFGSAKKVADEVLAEYRKRIGLRGK